MWLSNALKRLADAFAGIEPQRQDAPSTENAARKTISTERALRYVLELRANYDGPDREKYVCEIDEIVDDFRKKHGPQIPVAEAYALLKELEARFGRAE